MENLLVMTLTKLGIILKSLLRKHKHEKTLKRLNIKSANLAKKVEAIEMKKASSSKTNSEELCGICSTSGHQTQECPTIPAF